MQREVLLDHLEAFLFFALLGDVEDMSKEVYAVIIELKVECPLLIRLEKPLRCLIAASRVREEVQVVRVVFLLERTD